MEFVLFKEKVLLNQDNLSVFLQARVLPKKLMRKNNAYAAQCFSVLESDKP